MQSAVEILTLTTLIASLKFIVYEVAAGFLLTRLTVGRAFGGIVTRAVYIKVVGPFTSVLTTTSRL